MYTTKDIFRYAARIAGALNSLDTRVQLIPGTPDFIVAQLDAHAADALDQRVRHGQETTYLKAELEVMRTRLAEARDDNRKASVVEDERDEAESLAMAAMAQVSTISTLNKAITTAIDQGANPTGPNSCVGRLPSRRRRGSQHAPDLPHQKRELRDEMTGLRENLFWAFGQGMPDIASALFDPSATPSGVIRIV